MLKDKFFIVSVSCSAALLFYTVDVIYNRCCYTVMFMWFEITWNLFLHEKHVALNQKDAMKQHKLRGIIPEF